MIYVQFGGFTDCPEGWLNFEPSIHLRAARAPLVGRLLRRTSPYRFPNDVRVGDIVKGLPLPDDYADVVFSSHVIEHLPRNSANRAFENVYKLLKPGGRVRLVVPDLLSRAKFYAENAGSMKDPADWFMTSMHLGSRTAPRHGIKGITKLIFSTASHKWMWDYPTLSAALESAGFCEVRRAEYGDHGDDTLARAERLDRFYWQPFQGHTLTSADNRSYPELAIEARKPPL